MSVIYCHFKDDYYDTDFNNCCSNCDNVDCQLYVSDDNLDSE